MKTLGKGSGSFTGLCHGDVNGIEEFGKELECPAEKKAFTHFLTHLLNGFCESLVVMIVSQSVEGLYYGYTCIKHDGQLAKKDQSFLG